jgi:hypothetical protein
MSSSNIKTRQQAMLEDMERTINMVLMPGGSQHIQKLLMEAEQHQTTNIDGLARLISLANAALVVASSDVDDLFSPWYRDMAQRLLRRSMDALAVIEADQQPRLRPA